MKELDEKLHLKIMDYLHGRLDADTAKELELQMAEDKELAKLIKLHQMEKVAVDVQLRMDMKQQIAQWRTEKPLSESTKGKSSFRYLLWLLSFSFFVIAGSYFFSKGSKSVPPPPELPELSEPVAPTSSDTLPIANETPAIQKTSAPPALPKSKQPDAKPKRQTPNYIAFAEDAYRLPNHLKTESKRSIDSQSDTTLLQKGIKAFGAAKYSKAITYLEQLDESNSAFGNAKKWLAHAHFNEGAYAKAAVAFAAIAEDSRGRTKARAEWYLLLSLLPDYQNNQAFVNQLLDKMTDEEAAHIYLDEAKKIKEKIK